MSGRSDAEDGDLPRVLDLIEGGIILLDRHRRVARWNEWMARSSRIDAEQALGQTIAALFPDMAESRICRAVAEVFDLGMSSLISASLNKSLFPLHMGAAEDGAKAPIQQVIVIKPVPDLGRGRECLIQIHDVTNAAIRERTLREQARELEIKQQELVELADKHKAARDEAERATRTKSDFLANMSHELRTPLNAIIGFSEIIMEEMMGPGCSPRYRDYAKDIHGSAQHLHDLISDLLDLSKVETGQAELHEEDIDVPEVVRSCVKLMVARARECRVDLVTDVAEKPGPTLRADKRMFKQILINLISNAVKFTPPDGKVTVRAWPASNSGYVLQIIDTGIGISPEDIPKALAQFGQIDSDLSRKHRGTGLGLPLTKRLVELHGGSFDLQSEINVGTTVTARFPAETAISDQVELDAETDEITGA